MIRKVRKRINQPVATATTMTTMPLVPEHKIRKPISKIQSNKLTKLSFRTRALDPAKPMNIYIGEKLPHFTEYSAINRAIPQMVSGMEKGEESVSVSFFFSEKESSK